MRKSMSWSVLLIPKFSLPISIREKKIENYLLIPAVLERVVIRLITEKARQNGIDEVPQVNVMDLLASLTNEIKTDCQGQYVSRYCEYHRNSGRDQATLTSEALSRFESKWTMLDTRMILVPGKKILKAFRQRCQSEWGITLTDIRLIDGFQKEEIPSDLIELLAALNAYRGD